MANRHKRVGAEISRLLSELLLRGVKDPRLQDVQVSHVDVSGDLGVARVYFTMLDPAADPSPALAALDSANGFLRRRVGGALSLRRVPELRFQYDESARRGFELSQLIDRAVEAPAEPARDDED